MLTGQRPRDLGGVASGLATTGLWLFRLTSSFADPRVVGTLSGPVAALPLELQDEFRSHLVELPDDIAVLHLRDLAWPMALADDGVTPLPSDGTEQPAKLARMPDLYRRWRIVEVDDA